MVFVIFFESLCKFSNPDSGGGCKHTDIITPSRLMNDKIGERIAIAFTIFLRPGKLNRSQNPFAIGIIDAHDLLFGSSGEYSYNSLYRRLKDCSMIRIAQKFFCIADD